MRGSTAPNRLIVGDRVIQGRTDRAGTRGSSPIVPEPWQVFGNRILTSDTLFEQADLAAHGSALSDLVPSESRSLRPWRGSGFDVHGFDARETDCGISDEKVAQAAQDL